MKTFNDLDSTATFPQRLRINPDARKTLLGRNTPFEQTLKEKRMTRPSIPNEQANGYESIDLDNTSTIDLKKRFPVSRWLVVKEMFPWLAGFMVLLVIYNWNFEFSLDSRVQFPSQLSLAGAQAFVLKVDQLLLYSSALILTLVALYYELQRYFFQYRIEGFRIILRKGILLRDEGSLPLLPIAEVFSRRGFLDLIFGLYQVNIAVPVNSVSSFACIDGLNKKNASQLIEFISAQLSRQVSVTEPPKNMVTV